MAMIKTIILHHLPDMNDLPAVERWFCQYHCQEALFQAPWMTRYVVYRPAPPPPGCDTYGYSNYRVHENWASSADGKRGTNGMLSMTPEPAPMDVVIVSVPAEPTEDFVGSDMVYGEKTILRWLCIFRYPEGVSVEEGDRWYLTVHVPEVLKQPGLIRFFSHKAMTGEVPGRGSAKLKPFFKNPPRTGFHRVSELWYENNNGWVESILQSPPEYTKPSWTDCDEYPFLAPGRDFVSTFLLERPDQDLLRDYPYQYV